MATNIYATAKPLFNPSDSPGWIQDPDDLLRYQAYNVYSNIYYNVPNSFKLIQRGEENSTPIYLPSGRKIVEASNRFLGKDWDFVVNPKTGDPTTNGLLETTLRALFKKEQVYAKYGMQKRSGLIKGDAFWYIVGDGMRLPGQRISIYELDPGQVFPMYEDGDVDKIVGYHLAEVIKNPFDKTKTAVRRQTFRKYKDPNNGAITITSEEGIYEIDGWDDRILEPKDIKIIKSIRKEEPLDPRITSLPVYHIRNKRVSGLGFGSSELQGIERVLGAVNQAISDQELSLAFGGLGLYWTTSGPPLGADGQPIAWDISPARMIEVTKEAEVNRLDGVNNIDGSLAHIKFLLEEGQESIGIPSIATGAVDVQIAESGIALTLRLAPLLAANKEKEEEMMGTYDQFLYDIKKMWFPVYELTDFDGIEVTSVMGDPMPVDIDAEIARVSTMVDKGLMTISEARTYLAGIGVKGITTGENGEAGSEEVLEEQRKLAEARASDPFENRFMGELSENVNGNRSTGVQGITVTT